MMIQRNIIYTNTIYTKSAKEIQPKAFKSLKNCQKHGAWNKRVLTAQRHVTVCDWLRNHFKGVETLKAIINQYNMYFVMLHHVHLLPDPILFIVSSFVHMSVHCPLSFAKFPHKKPFKIVLITLKDITCTCHSKTVSICNLWLCSD